MGKWFRTNLFMYCGDRQYNGNDRTEEMFFKFLRKNYGELTRCYPMNYNIKNFIPNDELSSFLITDFDPTKRIDIEYIYHLILKENNLFCFYSKDSKIYGKVKSFEQEN